MVDQGMERILDLDGWWFWLPNGWSLRCHVRVVAKTEGRPHGIKYALNLHDVDGTRLLGFDNAQQVPKRIEYDHRHPLRRVEEHIPYTFIDADKLIADVFDAVEAACQTEGVPFEFEDQERRDDEDEITD